LIDIISIVPKELYDVKKVFWVDEIKNVESFRYILSPLIKDIEQANELNLNLPEIFINSWEYVKEQIFIYESDEYINNQYKEKCKIAFEEKIKEAESLLEKEKEGLDKESDGDLLIEIQFIHDELQNTKNNLDEIVKNAKNYEREETWWPEILYPVIDLKVFNPRASLLKEISENYII
jgi:hypothetical protein